MGFHGIITTWKNMVLMGVRVRIEPLKNQLGFSDFLQGKSLKMPKNDNLKRHFPHVQVDI